MTSIIPNSKADLNFSGVEPNIEVEPMVPHIIHKPKREEEGMAVNPREGFKER